MSRISPPTTSPWRQHEPQQQPQRRRRSKSPGVTPTEAAAQVDVEVVISSTANTEVVAASTSSCAQQRGQETTTVASEHVDERIVTTPANTTVAATAKEDTSAALSLSKFTADSDLSSGNRYIWIVTTAALPWRTGTAVNPLMRALYLIQQRQRRHDENHTVTLLIPWLEDIKARQKLYGDKLAFASPAEQEAWIRTFCRERAQCADEEPLLRIRFWKGKYNAGFGSIFPMEDICSLVPKAEADVCILEEPEHLNWFRVLPESKKGTSTSKATSTTATKTISNNTKANTTKSTPQPSPVNETEMELEAKPEERQEENDRDELENENHNDKEENEDYDELGWKHKFRHVVGILHTNYGAYIRQYGMGTSFLTAPALNALSSLVVRAYCHRLIRLSNSLTSLDPHQEVTSNVHGVRSEFLDPPVVAKHDDKDLTTPAAAAAAAAPVYFIGKLIWAKGFDKILELQELYRASTTKDEYFPMDVYGAGEDAKSIHRAFFGRHGPKEKGDDSSTTSSASSSETETNSQQHQQKEHHSSKKGKGIHKELVLHAQVSLRSFITGGAQKEATAPGNETAFEDDAASAAVLSVTSESSLEDEEQEKPGVNDKDEKKQQGHGAPFHWTSKVRRDKNTTTGTKKETFNPLEILGDLSEKTLNTSTATAGAALKLIESIMEVGLGTRGGAGSAAAGKKQQASEELSSSAADKESETHDEGNELDASNAKAATTTTTTTTKAARRKPKADHLTFIPPRSRFKWRRTPIPARFLGVQDHIVVRDIPEQKIFLNMSTTEVLCTTTAEALAMGKFVIVPKDPSNEFFYQFPNCLSYQDLDECVLRLQYALTHDPEPISDTIAHILSWDGATERLYLASGISEQEAQERKEKGLDKAYIKDAQFHVDTGRKSQFVGNLLSGKILR